MAVKLTSWSFSRWKAYDTCAQQAKFKYIDKIPEPPSTALENGKDVHDTLAAYVRGDLPANDPVPGWTYFEKLLRTLRTLNPMVEQEWGFRKDWSTTGWFGNDVYFRSKLDVCITYDDHTADIVDYKNGKPRLQDAQLQAETYAISVLARYPHINEVTVRFWFIDTGVQIPNDQREVVYRYARSMLADLQEMWKKRIKNMMSDERFVPKPGVHCKWCPFAKAKGGPCKYGA